MPYSRRDAARLNLKQERRFQVEAGNDLYCPWREAGYVSRYTDDKHFKLEYIKIEHLEPGDAVRDPWFWPWIKVGKIIAEEEQTAEVQVRNKGKSP